MKPDSGSRTLPPATYFFRRDLDTRDTLQAAGVAVGVGLGVFYLARLMLQRTPLAREETIPQLDQRGVIVRRPRRRRATDLAQR